MPPNPVVAPTLRVGYLRHDLLASIRSGNPKGVLRAIASFAAPSRWPTARLTRQDVQDAGMARGGIAAARAVAAELATMPAAKRPRTPESLRRATALDLVAGDLPPAESRIERTVAAFLRGELANPPSAGAASPDALAAEALAGVAAARSEGHADVAVVATFPGFHPNPYGALMESAYRGRGLVPVHAADAASVDAILARHREAGYRVIVHLNAPDRFVGAVARSAEAAGVASEALRLVDAWTEQGATIVCSIHNGPRLTGARGEAERLVAQGIVDRAALVHVLTASTPARLAGWISMDPARIVHVPHPNYDGALGPLPDRAVARDKLGIDGSGPEPIVIGLIGSLVARKGCLDLLDAFERVAPLPADGRPRRLVLAGVPAGPQAEDIIRRALANRDVVSRLGYVPDADLPGLLAALDAAVVPYPDLLNSGWLHLALTAGVPAIGPADSTAEEIVEPRALLTYEAGNVESLAGAIEAAGQLASTDARAAARRSVEQLDARALSARMAEAILGAMAATAAAARTRR